MSDPISIAEELLDSGDSQAQKNALTFLRVLGSDASVRRLVGTAVDHPQDATREAAFGEIDKLDPAGRRLAADALNETFAKENHGDRWGRAYFLLARLGERVKGRGFLMRLRCANAIHELASPSKGVAFYRRNWWPSILGASAGAFALLLYLGILTSLPSQVTTMVLIAAVLLAVPAGILVAYRATPFHYYGETLPGVIIECAWAASGVFVLGLVGVAVSYVLQLGSAAEALRLVVALAVAVGLIRAATILAFGSARRSFGVLAQVVAGAGVGTIVLTASALLDLGSLTSDYWPTIVALGFGVAATFAAVDRQGGGKSFVASPGRRAATGVLIAAFIALASWAGVRANVADTGVVDIDTTVDRLPKVLSFWLPEQQVIALGIEQRAQDNLVEVYVRDSAGNEVVAPTYDIFEPRSGFEESLKPGIYTVELTGFGQYSGFTPPPQSIVLPMLAGQRVVVETIGRSTPVAGEPLSVELMPIMQRDNVNVPQIVAAAEHSLPPGASDIEVSEVPFFHVFSLQEARTLRIRLHDTMGYGGAAYRLRLDGGESSSWNDSQISAGLLYLKPGNYRLAVYDSELHSDAFGESKAEGLPRTVTDRDILGGLFLSLESIDYPGDAAPDISLSTEGRERDIAITSIPTVKLVDVTGPTVLGVEAFLFTSVYEHATRLMIYDETGMPLAPGTSDFSDGSTIDSVLAPGRYFMLIDADEIDGRRGAGLKLETVDVSDTEVQFSVFPAEVYRPEGERITSLSHASLPLAIDVPVAPLVHFLSVPAGSSVAIRAFVDQTATQFPVDYTIALYGDDGIIEDGDDPDELEARLEAGEYWLAVEFFGNHGRSGKLIDGAISLPVSPASSGTVLRVETTP